MFRNIFKITAVAVVFLSLGMARVSASDWPMYNYNPAGNGAVSDLSIINNQSATPRYLDVPSNTQDQIIAEDKLFYSNGAAASTVYAYDLATLTLIWSKSFPKQVSRLVYADGNIYCGADAFYSLRASDGAVNWSTSAGIYYGSSTYLAEVYTVESGRLYGFKFFSNAHYLMALDTSNGNILHNSSIEQIDNIADLLISNDKIFTISSRLHGGGYHIRSWQKSDFTVITDVAHNDTSTPQTIYDAATDQLYLTANDGLLNRFRASDLALLDNFQTENMSRPVGYGSNYYAMWDRSLKSFTISTADHINLVKQNNLLPVGEGFYRYADPIIVNGMLYAGTNKGNIWAKNLETGELKTYGIDAGLVVDRIIYGSQYFVIRGGYGGVNGKRFFVYNYANLGVKAQLAGFSITSPYKTDGMNQYLGQTHAHDEPESLVPNGQPWIDPPSPADVETRYKNAGYSFVSLTEHNWLLPNPAVTGILHIENSEEITQDPGGDHILALGINSKIYPTGTDQERIDDVLMQGGVPILAHPNSTDYPFSLDRLNSLAGYNLIEISNAAMFRLNKFRIWGSSFAFDKWDTLLDKRKPIYGTGGDDYTPYDGGFDGAGIVVLSPTNTQADILANLKAGNFYALQGSKAPRINIEVNGNTFTVTSDQSSTITFIGKGGEKISSVNNTNIASYLIKGGEIYVRAEVKSADTGLVAWTQAVTIEPSQEQTTITAGEHSLSLGQAMLYSNASAPVTVRTLIRTEFPETMPPLGYLSPIYQLSTSGEVLNGNKLAISYTGKNLPVKPENLAIFAYDESLRQWVKTSSTIDDANKIVTAELPHYSFYTLSALIPEDTESPAVSLSSPTDLNNLGGTVDLSVTASDNQAVTSVKFVIDNREIGSDIIPGDGWTVSFDTADFTIGSHKLTLMAEDYSGNTSEQSYDITIAGGITAPTISITAPVTTDYLHDPSSITGTYTSQLAAAEISIYLDEVYIDKVDINATDLTYSKLIDWNQFREGAHKLKLELRDMRGNGAAAETDITIGQNVTVSIVSPQNKSYLRGRLLSITITTTPPNAYVKIYLDSTEIANNTSLDLINYVLGRHIIEVKFKDKIIASTTFAITTSYADTIKIVKRFEGEGRFKNNGIPTAIMAQLRVAELAGKFGLKRIEKIALQSLILFINQQAESKKPKIDGWTKTKLIEQIYYLRDNNK